MDALLLPNFGISEHNKVIVEFNKGPLSDDSFFQQNPLLHEMAQEKDPFLLENICQEEANNQDFMYVDYLAQVLKLLANMGADGNFRLTALLDKIGLSEDIITGIFNGNQFTPDIKMRYFS